MKQNKNKQNQQLIKQQNKETKNNKEKLKMENYKRSKNRSIYQSHQISAIMSITIAHVTHVLPHSASIIQQLYNTTFERDNSSNDTTNC